MRIRTRRPAGDTQSTLRRSSPARKSSTRSWASSGRAHVERLVVDHQPDEFAVGDVDDGLALLRIPIAALRVGQRPLLVEGVEIAAEDRVRFALVQIASQPDMPVREGEDRLGLREHVQVQGCLPDLPGLDREHRLADHVSTSVAGRDRCRRSTAYTRSTSVGMGSDRRVSQPLPDVGSAGHLTLTLSPAIGQRRRRIGSRCRLRRTHRNRHHLHAVTPGSTALRRFFATAVAARTNPGLDSRNSLVPTRRPSLLWRGRQADHRRRPADRRGPW